MVHLIAINQCEGLPLLNTYWNFNTCKNTVKKGVSVTPSIFLYLIGVLYHTFVGCINTYSRGPHGQRKFIVVCRWPENYVCVYVLILVKSLRSTLIAIVMHNIIISTRLAVEKRWWSKYSIDHCQLIARGRPI